jgi:hypothetical protein
MTASVQLIFASHWFQMGDRHAAIRTQRIVEVQRGDQRFSMGLGRCEEHPAIWIDASSVMAAEELLAPSRQQDAGLALALAAAVEATPEARHWLLLSHARGPHPGDRLEQRIKALHEHTLVTWRSADNALVAAGFSCEMYSELIRLDSAHALDRLLRRYPCLQLLETFGSFGDRGYSTIVNR